MLLRVDPADPLPVYEQIRQQIARMVITGTLAPETRLPTIRQLANDLHLAKGTVAKAYALLEEAGVIETRGHRGSFTLAPPAPGAPTAAAAAADPEPRTRELLDGLGQAADAYALVVRQLGLSLEDAQRAVASAWNIRPEPDHGLGDASVR